MTNLTNNTAVVRADDDEDEDGAERGRSARVLLGFVLFLLIVWTLLGNTLVCAAVVKFRHLRSKVTNFFVISLAVSDLFVAVLVMPWEAMSAVAGAWLFGRVFCAIWVAFDIMCSTASILNLCIISVDRYWAIASPFRYERKMTQRVAFVMIGVAWTLSVLISFIPVQLNWHEADEDEDGDILGEFNFNGSVSNDNCKANLNRTYAISSSLISFYIPVVIMIATYTRIFRIAQKQIRRISSLERAAGHDCSGDNSNSLKTAFKKETKVLKTLSVIMGVFVCCWLPFFVLNCVVPFCQCVSDTTFAVFVWFGWANSSLNPVIYAFNADFRKAFSSILGCHKLFPSTTVEAVNFSNELVSYHHDTTLQKEAPPLIPLKEEGRVLRAHKTSSLSSSSSCVGVGGVFRDHTHVLLPSVGRCECDAEISLDTITPFTSTAMMECGGIPGQIINE
ncbi:D(1) dopamine receptor [Tachysurus fulvidraco]|uniref:D(1) dopamine receptor n=1 Tax=Tachysurus fulvidraco TaxID=1234273 RepID=UPI000F4DC6A1|nr:D(1) dopamine receptor [Tachysurus fulvidraco]